MEKRKKKRTRKRKRSWEEGKNGRTFVEMQTEAGAERTKGGICKDTTNKAEGFSLLLWELARPQDALALFPLRCP
jgi:hypothetical protein